MERLEIQRFEGNLCSLEIESFPRLLQNPGSLYIVINDDAEQATFQTQDSDQACRIAHAILRAIGYDNTEPAEESRPEVTIIVNGTVTVVKDD